VKSLAKDEHNANATNQNVVTAVLAAGLYPNVIEVRSPVVYAETAHGSGNHSLTLTPACYTSSIISYDII
jgi:hypothetical protein